MHPPNPSEYSPEMQRVVLSTEAAAFLSPDLSCSGSRHHFSTFASFGARSLAQTTHVSQRHRLVNKLKAAMSQSEHYQ